MTRCFALLLCSAAPAYAHGSLPGGGGFYAGLAHPFLSVDHLIAIIAAGLVLAQHDLRWGLALLAIGVASGMALLSGIAISGGTVLMLVTALVAGASLALLRPLPKVGALILALICGLIVGVLTDVPKQPLQTALVAGAGVVLATCLIAIYAMAIGLVIRHRAGGLALRIAGSWIVATVLMMLAFTLRDMIGMPA